MPGGLHPVYQYHITGKDVKDKDLWLNRRHYAGTRLIAFLVAPLACCEARLNQSGCRVSVSVCVCLCVEIFFPTNPYLQAGLTDLDENLA